MIHHTFRAWDKFLKKYIFTGFSVIGEVTCFSCMEQVLKDTWEARKKEYGYKASIEAWNDIELEICTGAKDKNGILIYEHDILKTPYWDGTDIRVVEMEHGCFYPLDEFNHTFLEVIGNTRENAHLLKETK